MADANSIIIPKYDYEVILFSVSALLFIREGDIENEIARIQLEFPEWELVSICSHVVASKPDIGFISTWKKERR